MTVIHAKVRVFLRDLSAFCRIFLLSYIMHIFSQAKQSKQLVTKEICLLSEETK